MKIKNMASLAAAIVIVGSMALSAQAALMDRGGGLIYDTDLNITWLQDANLSRGAMGYGPGSSGARSWDNAVRWADDLVYHDTVRNVDYNDWRLPVTPRLYAYDGNGEPTGPSTGYTSDGEMGHLFYTELGNSAMGGVFNAGPFINLQRNIYWSVSVYPSYYPDRALAFDFGDGRRLLVDKTDFWYVWAVRDGDVAGGQVNNPDVPVNNLDAPANDPAPPVATPVPEPGTWMLLGSGLVGLVAFRKKFAQLPS